MTAERKARCSGGLLPPPPPAEKATAREDQTRQASTGDRPRHVHRWRDHPGRRCDDRAADIGASVIANSRRHRKHFRNRVGRAYRAEVEGRREHPQAVVENLPAKLEAGTYNIVVAE